MPIKIIKKGGKTGTTTPVGSFGLKGAAMKMSAKSPSQALSNLVKDSDMQLNILGSEPEKNSDDCEEPQISSSGDSENNI